MKSFREWFVLKPKLEEKEKKLPYFRERQIWWTHIGVNLGYEQDGHGDKALRPVLVLVKFNKHLFVGIPQTSQRKKKHDKYYFEYEHEGKIFTLLLLQIRVFSAKRLHEKLWVLDKGRFKEVKERIKDWL